MFSKTRVLVFCAVVTVLFVMTSRTATAAVGDSWSVSGDMQITSNPSPAIDPGAAGGGDATWEYTNVNTPVSGNLVGVVNAEMPDAGIGWYRGDQNWIGVISFTADAVPASAGGNDKTNFNPVSSGVAQVGGHAANGAIWTAGAGLSGDFQVDYLGFNARNQETASASERGRRTTLSLKHNSTEFDSQILVGGIDDGYANRYSNSTVLSISPGDTISIQQQGSDWNGFDMVVTHVPEPTTAVLSLIILVILGLVRQHRKN